MFITSDRTFLKVNFKFVSYFENINWTVLVFSGQRVLVIGSGPSGRDLAIDLASHATHVYLSHRSEIDFTGFFPDQVSTRPGIEKITKTGSIKFVDGLEVIIDSIIWCTGYNYSFSFLSPDCGINLNGNQVQKLFKHLINIEYPTMFFIGIIFPRVIMFLMQLQVEYCIKLLKYPGLTPSKEFMIKDYYEDMRLRRMDNVPNRKMHMIFPYKDMRAYIEELTKLGDIVPLQPVILNLMKRVFEIIEKDYPRLRRYQFKIIDKTSFIEKLNDLDTKQQMIAKL